GHRPTRVSPEPHAARAEGPARELRVKITRVETAVVNLPMVIDGATPKLRDRAVTSIDVLLVRVDTDGGVTGWGESFGHRIFPATRAAIDTVLGPMCVGRDPSLIAAIDDDLQRQLHGLGRTGPTSYALSGIDIALVDGGAGDRDGAAAGAARPALAGGAGVPARERRGPRRGAAARRHPHGGR